MKIAVDAMGGDYAPEVVIEGVAQALKEYPKIEELVLVGDEAKLTPLIEKNKLKGHSKIRIKHASQVVEMHEPATIALRAKKDSSITVSADIAKAGEVDAIVSAGHTGAAVACSVLRLRTLPGVDRPGIATVFPTVNGHFTLVDAGANPDAIPEHLVQYAVMGEIYTRKVLKIDNPRVGLLSNGEEESKGNELTKATFKLLKKLPINFIGNVEGHDLFAGNVDVVVCDGFVGNILLKSCESLAKALGGILKDKLTQTPIRKAGALLAKNAFKEAKKVGDYAEHGGAPLLGINGICIIGHGGSSAKAVKNAIRVASECIENQVNDTIVKRIKETIK